MIPETLDEENPDLNAVAPVIPGSIPGGNLSVDQLALAATMPPPVAPDLVDSELAKVQPLQSTPIIEPKTPEEAQKQNLEKLNQATGEKAAATEEAANIETQKAAQREEFLKAHETKLNEMITRQEAQRRAASAEVSVVRQKAETEPYHTFWESRTNGQSVAIAIGLIANGVSWNPAHVNRGVELLQTAMKNEDELQRQKHANLWKAVESAERGERELDSSQLHELAGFQASEGARWDAVAGRFGAMVAANKGKGDVAEAKKQAAEAAEKAATAWSNAQHATALANHLTEVDREKKRHDLEVEQAKKKKASGGGGGGTGLDRAAAKLQNEIEQAKQSGTPLSGGQIADRAIALGIPREAKAGRVSLKTIMDEVNKEGKTVNADLKFDEAEANKIVRFDGKPAAIAGSAKIASKAMDEDVQRGDAINRLNELAKDIKQYGGKINPTDSDAIQRRVSKFANAIIAIGIVSPLGKTNETLHLETKALGIPGVPDWEHLTESLRNYVTTGGANLENVERKIEETKRNREAHRQKFQPLTEEQKKKYGATSSPTKRQYKEGDTSTSGGKPIVFKNGKWEEVI